MKIIRIGKEGIKLLLFGGDIYKENFKELIVDLVKLRGVL